MKKVIYSDNGTLADFSTSLNEYRTLEESFSLVSDEDAIYIGSDLPFNHFFLKMGSTVNAETSSMSISVWDGTTWNAAVNITDETSVSGATLAQDGFITFIPDKDKTWYLDDTLYGGHSITGLGDVTTPIVIYDQYWIKITFSADLTADVDLKFIGEKFSDDADLRSEYASLMATRLLTAWESGKTDWEEQHIQAAKLIVKDLKFKKRIKTEDQILRKEDLTLAAVSKVAEIIYVGRGQEFEEDRKNAQSEYEKRLASAFPVIDRTNDAIVDNSEVITSTRFAKLRRC